MQPVKAFGRVQTTFFTYPKEGRAKHTVVGEVEIEIDVRQLLIELGAQALRNKGGKAKTANGLIICKVKSRETTTEEA